MVVGVITTQQYDHVCDIIARIADAEILSRFRALDDADISEKNPGDLVTTADRVAEERLSEALEALIPGSVTVGEEGVAADTSVLQHLATDTPAWIIDPVDGTKNFVAGEPDYCCLVSLSTHEQVHASWIYAPSLHLWAGAHNGHGAWINGAEVSLQPSGPKTVLDIVTTHPSYLTGYGNVLERLQDGQFVTTPCRTAGLSYVDLVQGTHDAVVYTWQHPWDHAAGLHLLAMAGGENVTMDGTPFRVSGNNALPFVAGPSSAVATVADVLGIAR